jgi:hypothetical protein
MSSSKNGMQSKIHQKLYFLEEWSVTGRSRMHEMHVVAESRAQEMKELINGHTMMGGELVMVGNEGA